METTVTISDGVHRVAKLTTTPSGAVEAKTLRKLKTDLNRTHYQEGRYDEGKIAKLCSQALDKLETAELEAHDSASFPCFGEGTTVGAELFSCKMLLFGSAVCVALAWCLEP